MNRGSSQTDYGYLIASALPGTVYYRNYWFDLIGKTIYWDGVSKGTFTPNVACNGKMGSIYLGWASSSAVSGTHTLEIK